MLKEKFAEPWKEFAARWEKFYTPPGRPSEEAIRYYKKFCRIATKGLKRRPRGLVLGSTPELRDILFDLKFEVTMIDINEEMIFAMSEFTKSNPNEIIVRGSWTDMPFADDYYDVVLGDLVLSNVPAKLHTKFLKEVQRVLNKNGAWITKVDVVPDDWIYEIPEEVLKKYEKIPSSKNRAMELMCHLLRNTYNKKNHTTSTKRIRKWIEVYRTTKGFNYPNKKVAEYLNDIWEMWKPMEKIWSTKTEAEKAKQISPYFKIIDKHVLSDCFYKEVDKTFPMWFCKVKK